MGQVVIAARGGPQAKSRLAELLSPEDRAGLVEVMLRDMLEAAASAPRVGGLWVVTPTAALADIAREAGAQVIDQAEPVGLNAAFRQALAAVGEAAPYETIALLPGDLPLLAAGDLEAALALAEAHGVALAPAIDGGTGALVLRAGVELTPRFGARSFGVHSEQAARRGLSVAVLETESLARDLDRPEDATYVMEAAPGRRTALFLSERLSRLTAQ